jgi:hypothetical protein
VSATGEPFEVPPYPVPLFDGASPTFNGKADPNSFVAWGGPPAFEIDGNPDSVVGSTDEPTDTAGVSEGLDVFAGVTPISKGSYTLGLSIPANTGTVRASQTATLTSVGRVLGTAVAPTFTPDGAGGGTLDFTMPTGATEAYVELIDFGPAGASPAPLPVYYTIETTASGTLTLPDAIGPSVAPSTATNDQLVVQVIGFDYPAYELDYPKSLGNPKPAITTTGQHDITISTAACQIVAGASCTDSLPLLRRRSELFSQRA